MAERHTCSLRALILELGILNSVLKTPYELELQSSLGIDTIIPNRCLIENGKIMAFRGAKSDFE